MPDYIGEYIVSTPADRVRVRMGAGLEYPALVALPPGAKVNVIKMVGDWAQVEVKMGDIIPIMDADVHVPAFGYMLGKLLKPAAQPPPPSPAGKFNRLGVNVINYGRGAEKAIALGCKIVLVMDDEDLAAGIKRAHPDVFVIFRRFVSSWKLNGDELANRIGGQYPYIDAYQLFNEADSWGYGGAAEINTRINHELRAADLLLAKGCGVMLGSYSMGCPDFTSQYAVDACKRYAPYYNNNPRVSFDIHSYSPAMGRHYQPGTAKYPMRNVQIVTGNVGRNLQALATWEQDADTKFLSTGSPLENKPMDYWFEGRWRWLFSHCGFDPRQRKILMSETGIDEGGVGGFPAHNANLTEFGLWVKNWLAYQAEEVYVNGTGYASPVLGSTIYQYGDNTNQSWNGYEIAAYMSELKRLAW